MSYHFEQLGEVSCRDIAASLRQMLVGKLAVNTAFDSGLIQHPEWRQVNGFSITPVITESFVADWPVSHDEYCDEWWVFERDVPADFTVHSFCNFVGMAISDYKALDWQDGCPLDSYLERFSPVAVFGNNELGYVISKA